MCALALEPARAACLIRCRPERDPLTSTPRTTTCWPRRHSRQCLPYPNCQRCHTLDGVRPVQPLSTTTKPMPMPMPIVVLPRSLCRCSCLLRLTSLSLLRMTRLPWTLLQFSPRRPICSTPATCLVPICFLLLLPDAQQAPPRSLFKLMIMSMTMSQLKLMVLPQSHPLPPLSPLPRLLNSLRVPVRLALNTIWHSSNAQTQRAHVRRGSCWTA
jgi:hypothetical protein